MPQMSPMLWLFLYLFFSFMVMIMIMIIHNLSFHKFNKFINSYKKLSNYKNKW